VQVQEVLEGDVVAQEQQQVRVAQAHTFESGFKHRAGQHLRRGAAVQLQAHGGRGVGARRQRLQAQAFGRQRAHHGARSTRGC
jgi:hypothetical protein